MTDLATIQAIPDLTLWDLRDGGDPTIPDPGIYEGGDTDPITACTAITEVGDGWGPDIQWCVPIVGSFPLRFKGTYWSRGVTGDRYPQELYLRTADSWENFTDFSSTFSANEMTLGIRVLVNNPTADRTIAMDSSGSVMQGIVVQSHRARFRAGTSFVNFYYDPTQTSSKQVTDKFSLTVILRAKIVGGVWVCQCFAQHNLKNSGALYDISGEVTTTLSLTQNLVDAAVGYVLSNGANDEVLAFSMASRYLTLTEINDLADFLTDNYSFKPGLSFSSLDFAGVDYLLTGDAGPVSGTLDAAGEVTVTERVGANLFQTRKYPFTPITEVVTIVDGGKNFSIQKEGIPAGVDAVDTAAALALLGVTVNATSDPVVITLDQTAMSGTSVTTQQLFDYCVAWQSADLTRPIIVPGVFSTALIEINAQLVLKGDSIILSGPRGQVVQTTGEVQQLDAAGITSIYAISNVTLEDDRGKFSTLFATRSASVDHIMTLFVGGQLVAYSTLTADAVYQISPAFLGAPITGTWAGESRAPLTFTGVADGNVREVVSIDQLASNPQSVRDALLLAPTSGLPIDPESIDAAISNGASADITAAKDEVLNAIAAGVTLTTTERSALAVEIEAAIIDENDGQQVIAAIIAAIDNYADLDSITLTAIRAQIDAALTSYDAPTRTEATTDKNEILGAVGTGGVWTGPQRDAVIAALDTTVSSRATPAEITDALNSFGVATTTDINAIDTGSVVYGEALNVIDSTPRLSVTLGGASCAKSTIRRYRGDTYPMALKVNNADGQGQNITGSTLTLSVNPVEEPTAGNYIFQITATVLDALEGLWEFSFTPAEVDHVGQYHYDIQMTSTSGEVRTLVRGRWIFEEDIGK